MEHRRYGRWEERRIGELKGTVPARVIAKRLNRTPKAIRSKIAAMHTIPKTRSNEWPPCKVMYLMHLRLDRCMTRMGIVHETGWKLNAVAGKLYRMDI
jgi:hypothetical protein